MVGLTGLVQGQRRVEAAVEDELRDLVVVTHVVALRVGQDQVRASVADEIDDRTLLRAVGSVDLTVAEAESRVLGPADLRRAASLRAANACDLLRGVNEAATVAARRMAHHDIVALLHEAGQRPAAQDLEVVRVGADGENSHTASVRALARDAMPTFRQVFIAGASGIDLERRAYVVRKRAEHELGAKGPGQDGPGHKVVLLPAFPVRHSSTRAC